MDEGGPALFDATVNAAETQIQGGMLFGLTAALFGTITFEGGRVVQSNFHDYQPLHLDQVPAVEVRLIKSAEEDVALGNSGYRGVHKRTEAQGPTWHVAMMPSKQRALNPFFYPDMVAECVEKMKAGMRAKVEHPFRVLKRQFGYTKVRYRGLAKITVQIVTLFALSNLPLCSS